VPTQLFASKMDISRIWLWLNVDVSHHKCPKVLSEFIFAFFPDECVTFVTWKKRSDSNIFPVIQSYWSKFSPWIPVQGLCGRLLRRDPEARWTAEEALHHWLYILCHTVIYDAVLYCIVCMMQYDINMY
jgi:hypothetical protein